MMKRTLRILLGSGLQILMLIAIGHGTVTAQSEPSSNRSIVGVWKTTVTPRDCGTGNQIMPAFEGLLTFGSDGTLAETSSGSAPGTRGPGHGIWNAEAGWRTYSMSFLFQRFAPSGLIGTTVVRQVLQLDWYKNDFTSTGTVEIVGNAGETLATLCTTSTGTRFE